MDMKHTFIGKRSVLAIAIVVMLVCALALTVFAMSKTEKAYAEYVDPTIEFNVSYSIESPLYYAANAYDAEHPTTLTVTYTVTYNDGINNIVLVPTYNATYFTLTNIAPKNDTVLGTATVTGDEVEADVTKIAFEGATKYTATGDALLVLTYELSNEVVTGDYAFGLQLEGADASTANYIGTGEQLGEQFPVQIVFVSEDFEVITKKQPVIVAGYNRTAGNFYEGEEFVERHYYFFEYGKASVATTQAASLTLSNEGDNEYEALEPTDPAG